MGLICLREEIKSGNNKSVFVMEAGLRESYRGCGGVRSPPGKGIGKLRLSLAACGCRVLGGGRTWPQLSCEPAAGDV